MILKWSDLGISGQQRVRDLWRQQDLDNCIGQSQTPVPRHGVVLLKVTPGR